MVSAVTGRRTDLAAFIRQYFLLLDSGKVEDETLGAAGRGKHSDRGLGPGIDFKSSGNDLVRIIAINDWNRS